MTLTAPVPIYDLGAMIRAGLHPVVREARLHETLLRRPDGVRGVDVIAWQSQLVATQATVKRAIERTLDAYGIALDDGATAWQLERAPQGHFTLVGTWRPL